MDQSTLIPGTAQTFSSFGEVDVHGGDFAFSANKQAGLYA
jgi:hypothetical protein